jgi:hypothetical protein
MFVEQVEEVVSWLRPAPLATTPDVLACGRVHHTSEVHGPEKWPLGRCEPSLMHARLLL